MVSLRSGGEEKLPSNLFNLALSDFILDQGKQVNFMVFDEATDNLDEDDSTIFIDLIQELVLEKRKIFFVITHNQYIENLVDAVASARINVVKKNGVSEVSVL